MNKNIKKYGLGTERLSFQRTENDLEMPNLLDIQLQSFQDFLETGMEEVFNEIYPIESKRLTVKFVKLEKIELPKGMPTDPAEAEIVAKEKGRSYEATVKAKFRLIDNETGKDLVQVDPKTGKSRKVDPVAVIGKMPLMTPGGSFIINGSERVIISQIIRAPGVYFEDMKAARTHSASDASVYKQVTVIPSRGA